MARQPATALWERVKQPFFMGFEVFIESLRRQVPAGSNRREVLPARALPIPTKPPVDLAQQSADRDDVIATADLSGSYTLKKIGDYFGPHYLRPSRIVRLTEQARRTAKRKTRPLRADPSSLETMIDSLENNTMLAERIESWFEEATLQGRREGRMEGEAQLLARLLERRFGPLPAAVAARLGEASESELEAWAETLLTAGSLNEVFTAKGH